MLDLFSNHKIKILQVLAFSVLGVGCATGQSATEEQALISDPFAAYAQKHAGNGQGITLRSKQGDRALEIDLPYGQGSDWEVPMNPSALAGSPDPHALKSDYTQSKPTRSDRELASSFVKMSSPEDERRKHEIEGDLGVEQTGSVLPQDESYLARLDLAKQLFKKGRLEASLIEVDHLIRDYPTSPRLHEMRGTLLDRMGYSDLAMNAWKQALEFDPKRVALQRWVEKKEAQRSIASEKKD